MSEYRREILTMVSIAVLGVLVIESFSIYLTSNTGNSQSGQSEDTSYGATTASSTTGTTACNSALPLLLTSVDFIYNGSGSFLYSRWSSCSIADIAFNVESQGLRVNATVAGKSTIYDGTLVTGSSEVAVAQGSLGSITELVRISGDTNLNGAVLLVSGSLLAASPVSAQPVSSPQSFQVFSTVGYTSSTSTLSHSNTNTASNTHGTS